MRRRSLAAAAFLILAVPACDRESDGGQRERRVTRAQAKKALCDDLADLSAEVRRTPGLLPPERLERFAGELRRDAQLYASAGDPVTADSIRDLIGALKAANEASGRTQLAVYLQSNVKRGDVARLRALIASMPQIGSARFVSRQAVLAQVKRLYKDDPELLGELDPRGLPAFFRVEVKRRGQFRGVSRILAAQPGVEQVRAWTGLGLTAPTPEQLGQLCE